ncbi:MAG: YoaK family protein [Acinetobacter sp.]|nr:YoaK family protein [Acinetobacter sp.]
MSTSPFQSLPNWIQFGAFSLAFNAGMINVLGLLTLLHQSVSHMTGNVSILAMDIVQGDWEHLLFLFLVVCCFLIGSFYSGFILGNGNFLLGRRYGLPLTLVSLSILLCWVFLPYFPRYALLWASVAMGIQNAMVSHYKGTIIRTTHLSGVLTDLGLAFGYIARGLNVDKRRIVLHFLLIAGFLFGGLLAAWVYPYLHLQSFLLPFALSACISMVYWVIYFRIRSPKI